MSYKYVAFIVVWILILISHSIWHESDTFNKPEAILRHCKRRWRHEFYYDTNKCFPNAGMFVMYIYEHLPMQSLYFGFIFMYIYNRLDVNDGRSVYIFIVLSIIPIFQLVSVDHANFLYYVEPYSNFCNVTDDTLILVKNGSNFQFTDYGNFRFKTVEINDVTLFSKYSREISFKDFALNPPLTEIEYLREYSAAPGVRFMFGFDDNVIKFCVNPGVPKKIIEMFTVLLYNYLDCVECLSTDCKVPRCTSFII